MRFFIIFLSALPLVSRSQNKIDSFYRSGKYWYCSESRDLPIRRFYPKQELITNTENNFDSTSYSKHYDLKPNRKYVQYKPMIWQKIDKDIFAINSPYNVFMRVTLQGKLSYKVNIHKGFNRLYTKQWSKGKYNFNYFIGRLKLKSWATLVVK